MSINFQIPRRIDSDLLREILAVMRRVVVEEPISIGVTVPYLGEVAYTLAQPDLESWPGLHDILDLRADLIQQLRVKIGGTVIFSISRDHQKPTDEVKFSGDWSANKRTKVITQLSIVADLRNTLGAISLEASLVESGSNGWDQYRSAAAQVLNSLQNTTNSLIQDVAASNLRLEEDRQQRYTELERSLREQLEEQRHELQSKVDQQFEHLKKQEDEHELRVRSFNTKEAHYVARAKQDDQITKIQNWLNGWSLTSNTSKKRWPTLTIYIVAMTITLMFAVWATDHNYNLLATAQDIAALSWWQWITIALKSVLPLAAFTTFAIYFIRWTSDWARRHAEEEFELRNRLIDIGRAGWILEAVRDAHEHGGAIPTELLKDLSRNLFTDRSAAQQDVSPAAFSDLLLQGLSSLRIKTPDGSEVEATRGAKR